MISLSQIHLGAMRLEEFRRTSTAARLKRAGYADGERRPRLTRHWANR